MHKTLAEARALARDIRQGLPTTLPAEVAVAPPFTALEAVAAAISGSPIRLAAQDAFWEKQGPYTGAISPLMLKDLGCYYVIIGHSERRQHFGETNEMVNRKLKAVLAAGLNPILCVGETLKARQVGLTLKRVGEQLREGLDGLPPNAADHLIIAYEPVWAIGTGHTATPEQAQEVHYYIRSLVAQILGRTDIRILYGGSVTPDNAASLLREPDINGALVGGASLTAEAFLKIIAAAGS